MTHAVAGSADSPERIAMGEFIPYFVWGNILYERCIDVGAEFGTWQQKCTQSFGGEI